MKTKTNLLAGVSISLKRETFVVTLLSKVLTVCILIFVFAPAKADPPWHTKLNLGPPQISRDDMKTHIQAHRMRVRALGIALVRQYPSFFNLVSEEMVERVLSVHDQSKLTYELYIGSTKVDVPDFLSRFFGQTLSETQKRVLVDGIKQFNSKDRLYVHDAIQKELLNFPRSQHESLIQQLNRIEQLADIVDRGMDPMAKKEFGRAMHLASVTYGEASLRHLAEFLEWTYSRITAGLDFESVRVRRAEIAARKQRLQSASYPSCATFF